MTLKEFQLCMVAFLLCSLVGGCTVPQGAKDQDASRIQSQVPDDGVPRPLIEWMRTLSGVTVAGSAGDYSVLVRGANSFSAAVSNEPLYVVDGSPAGRTYRNVAASLDPNIIKSVTVLPAPRAGKYGSQGANGVIEIKTKRTTL